MEDSRSSTRGRFRLRAGLMLVLLAATSCWGSERLYKFNIPAESIPQALRIFHLQSGVSIVFAPHRKWLTVRTHAVVGVYTPSQALDRMLDGTALMFGYEAENSIFVQETAYVDPNNTKVHQVLGGGMLSKWAY